MLLCALEAYFPVMKDISSILKCLQWLKISMSSANHLEIVLVTLLMLYFLNSNVTTLICIQVKNGLVRLKKRYYFFNLLAWLHFNRYESVHMKCS